MENNPKESYDGAAWMSLVLILSTLMFGAIAALMWPHTFGHHAAEQAASVAPSAPAVTPNGLTGGEEQSPPQEGSCTAQLTQLLEHQAHVLREVQSIREDVRLLVFRAR